MLPCGPQHTPFTLHSLCSLCVSISALLSPSLILLSTHLHFFFILSGESHTLSAYKAKGLTLKANSVWSEVSTLFSQLLDVTDCSFRCPWLGSKFIFRHCNLPAWFPQTYFSWFRPLHLILSRVIGPLIILIYKMVLRLKIKYEQLFKMWK